MKPKHRVTKGYTQPFLVKNGKTIVFKGTQSECVTEISLSKSLSKNGDLKLVRNPRFKWIKEEK